MICCPKPLPRFLTVYLFGQVAVLKSSQSEGYSLHIALANLSPLSPLFVGGLWRLCLRYTQFHDPNLGWRKTWPLSWVHQNANPVNLRYRTPNQLLSGVNHQFTPSQSQGSFGSKTITPHMYEVREERCGSANSPRDSRKKESPNSS